MGQRSRGRFVYADLAVVVALGLVAGLAILPDLLGTEAAWASLLRLAVAGPFLLVAPGYALVAALFPDEAGLSVLERSVFSVGASLALVALVGVALETLPPGVTVATVLASQIALVGLLAAIATGRRRRAGVRSVGYLAVLRRAWEGRNAIGGGNRALQVALVVAVLLTVGATAYAATQPLPSERYSELYLLGPDGTVEDVPETGSPGEEMALTVGVASQEHRTTSMDLQAQVVLPNGDREVVWTQSGEIAHDETREFPLSLRMPSVESGSRVKVEVLLFQDGAPDSPVVTEEAYRSVHTWVTVGGTGTEQSSETP